MNWLADDILLAQRSTGDLLEAIGAVAFVVISALIGWWSKRKAEHQSRPRGPVRRPAPPTAQPTAHVPRPTPIERRPARAHPTPPPRPALQPSTPTQPRSAATPRARPQPPSPASARPVAQRRAAPPRATPGAPVAPREREPTREPPQGLDTVDEVVAELIRPDPVALTVAELRRAVVLSEILRPPIALRDA